jgi:hypothetical protein
VDHPRIAATLRFLGIGADWRMASRHSAGIAPDPATTPEAVVQVYGARIWSWRGALSVHTWIAAKREGATRYRTYEFLGWRAWSGRSAVLMRHQVPDRHWFGNRPKLYADIRGDGVDQIIDKIEAAVPRYPYGLTYRLWPGPNSNTLVAFVARQVPELRLDMPPHAVGKDWLGLKSAVARAPSCTGYQVSLFGLFGVLLAWEEGLEVNLFGFTFGVDPLGLAIKLPFWDRIGVPRRWPRRLGRGRSGRLRPIRRAAARLEHR